MVTRYNPALREEPRNQPMVVVPPVPKESLLGWLENTGRFRDYEPDELQHQKVTEDLDDILDPELYILESEEQNEEESFS